jgi:hypothetical protein
VPADWADPDEVLALEPELFGELVDDVGPVVAELDGVGDVGPVDVVSSVGDWAAPVELLVLDELELSVCPCADRGPHPARARTATPAVTAVATRVFMPLRRRTAHRGWGTVVLARRP